MRAIDSFILTNNGWIRLKDINIRSDKIATLKNNNDLDYVYASDNIHVFRRLMVLKHNLPRKIPYFL